MKCGDKVTVIIEDHVGPDGTRTFRWHECCVYGEVYKSKFWKSFGVPGPNYLAAIEVYVNQKVYEIPMEKVISESR